jgi:hypothetical protein
VTILSAMLEPDPDKRPKSITPLLGGFEVRGKVRIAPPPSPPPPKKSSAPPPPKQKEAEEEEEEPQSDAVADALRLVRRYIGLIWVLVGFAWWLMPSGVAMGVTVGTIILTVAANVYKRREAQRKKTFRRYGRSVAVRIATPDEEIEAEHALREREEEERARRR